MKTIIYITVLFLFGFNTFAQFQVNGTHSAQSLVSSVLFNNSCGSTSNYSFSSNQNVGYFNRNSTSFPIQEGVIIRSGNIAHSTGNYLPDLTRLTSQINSTSDAFLTNLSNSSGQTSNITDTAFLQFDFNTASSVLSFDFLFASNEYGQFQCGFSDVFAFILTDLVTNVSTNLAVVPATNIPISVKTIRDNVFNAGCTSSFSEYFGSYNVANPASSPINFRGQTVLLNASSNIIPNRDYRIRLVIGDYNDASFDSAIFISNGEFITYTDLGPDFSICNGNTSVLQSGLSASTYTFKWFRNGVEIAGATSPSYTVTQSGTYSVEALEIGGNCKLVDEVVVTDLTYTTPSNIVSCNTATIQNVFNLNVNNAQSLGLDPSIYEVRYFKNNVLIPTNQYNNYNGVTNETIFIRIFNLQTNQYCILNLPVQLQIANSTNANQPNDVVLCQGTTNFDLTSVNPQVLNGANPNNYNISFHSSSNDAQFDTNPILNVNNFPVSGDITIWIRLELISNSVCFATTSFQISLVATPLVDTLSSVVTCSSYILPNLTNGNYFTQSNGMGVQLSAGNTINQTTTLFIYNQVPNSDCTAETSFTITVQLPSVFQNTIDACSDTGYIIPNIPFGNLYTQPNGGGQLLAAGTIINTSQTIHYYYNLNGTICANQSIAINIIQNPVVSTLPNYISCLSYTLPVIANGSYFTGPNGTGTQLFPGDVISSTQTIYIFSGSGVCISESTFVVTILVPEDISNISGCGEVIVPSYIGANFYTQPGGQGTLIPAGTVLTTNQTIYLYFPDIEILCITYAGTLVTINPLPLVDQLNDVFVCEGGGYVLPPLTNGYYLGTNGNGENNAPGVLISQSMTITIENQNTNCTDTTTFDVTIVPTNIVLEGCLKVIIPSNAFGGFFQNPNGQNPIPVGTELTTSQTIYFYSNLITTTPNCTENTTVQVNVFQIPPVDDPADVVTCGSYTLPPLQNGGYYQTTGESVPVGTVITQNTTLFTYNFNQYCDNIRDFNITIIDLNNFQDVESCGKYIVPVQNVGNYYTQANGQGNIIQAGTEIISSQTIYYYVAVTDNVSNNCTNNLAISITITTLPVVDDPDDRIECSSYTLPALTNGAYFLETGGVNPVPVGTIITQSTTIYVYRIENGCPNENNFFVQITTPPFTASFSDVFECYSYILPPITAGLGNYYTLYGGLGQQLQSGTEITSTQTIYIFNPNPILASCYGQTVFTVNIEGVQITPINPVARCDSYMLPTLSVGNYFSSTGGVNPINPLTPITTTQTIYVYAENVNTRGDVCFDEESFLVTITNTPFLTNLPDVWSCGSYVLQPLAVGNYFTQPLGQGTMLNVGDTITNSQLLYIYAVAPDNSTCYSQDSFTITIYPNRILNISNGVICYDYQTNQIINASTLVSGVNPNQFNVNWYFNNQLVHTGANYVPTQFGTYTVSTEKINPEGPNDCNYLATQVEVIRSSPIVANIIYNEAFTNETFIEVVTIGGYGTYEYQLNDRPFQSSPRFENLPSGYYTVTIRDTKGGCNSVTLEAFIINYPKFFTPNNDGFNDTWNITDLFTFKEAKIHIFDRYGKFLKEIFPNKAGWDGRYNNEEMFSSDYWFVVYYEMNGVDKEFKAHFSLKR